MKLSRRSFLKGLAAIGGALSALPVVKPDNETQTVISPSQEADEEHPYFVGSQWCYADLHEFGGAGTNPWGKVEWLPEFQNCRDARDIYFGPGNPIWE